MSEDASPGVEPSPAPATEPEPAEPMETAEAEPAAAASEPEPEPPPDQPAKRPLVRRHHWIVRTTHWLNALLLAGMIMSGLQIYQAFPHFGMRDAPYLFNPWDNEGFPKAVRLGGWLAGGLNWHFTLAWPFVLTGLIYLLYLAFSGEWRSLLFRPSDAPKALQMQLYYLRLRKEHPPQGKHNALQKGAYSGIFLLGVVAVLSGFALYKPAQLSWLVAGMGGYELARYWHFWSVWLFVGFTAIHVLMVFLVDPASMRAMITGWYRGRFPSHE